MQDDRKPVDRIIVLLQQPPSLLHRHPVVSSSTPFDLAQTSSASNGIPHLHSLIMSMPPPSLPGRAHSDYPIRQDALPSDPSRSQTNTPASSTPTKGISSSHRSHLLQPSPVGQTSTAGSASYPASPLQSTSNGSHPITRMLSRTRSGRAARSPDPSARPSVATSSTSKDPRSLSVDPLKSPMSENGSLDVIETPYVRLDRDPGTGRKMINQYVVLHEIGHGTHGRVRLGQDMSAEGEEGPDSIAGEESNAYYAIKIVDRNSRKKKLTGFSKQKALSRTDGGKLVNEGEIRKEIAIFKKVNHPNVVRMKEIIDDPENSKLFMILEYCDRGEIRWKDEDGRPMLTVAETRRIFRETVLGLEYLHHQGIIHRDIKPSNLLLSADGTVKISDFGCSHYSEALRAASAVSGPEGDEYVDDIELAKTAGSPAFFAPEMCYSGGDPEPERRSSSHFSQADDIPAVTIRPPSTIGDGYLGSAAGPLLTTGSTNSQIIPLGLARSNDSSNPRSREVTNTGSTTTIPQQPRLPITNAIDVWALGVTLYCLLFGKTPFDAPNEYLLMQAIPTAEIEIPRLLGADRLNMDGNPEDSQEARDCVDLLRRLLEKDPSRRITLDQVKKHPFTLRGLPDPAGWLASTDPHAQTSVTVSNDEVEAVVIKSSSFRDRFRKGIKSISTKLHIFGAVGRNRSSSMGEKDTPQASSSSSASPSEVNLQNLRSGVKGGSRKASGDPSPLFSPGDPDMGRRPSLLGTAISPQRAPAEGGPSHTMSPIALVPVSAGGNTHGMDRAIRSLTSSSSLDKMRHASESGTPSFRRRQSSDIDVLSRPRSPSNASSNGHPAHSLGNKLVRLLSRNSSQRSRRREKHHELGQSLEDSSQASGLSPSTGIQSIDDRSIRRSLETFESSSYSSSRDVGPSPDNVPRSLWDAARLRPNQPRRGSALSEDIAHDVVEEVDWNEPLSDDDDYDESASQKPSTRRPSVISLSPSWRRNIETSLGLDFEAGPLPVSAPPHLDSIPFSTHPPSPNRSGRSNSLKPSLACQTLPRSGSLSSRSPFSATYDHERARSPLGPRDDRSLSAADDGEDDGLAISFGSRRGRRGSTLDRRVE